MTIPRVNRVGFSCLAPIARYSWSCPLLFPEWLHSNIRGESETLRSAKHLVPINGYDHYSLWLCQDFSQLSVVNRDNHSGCFFSLLATCFFKEVGTSDLISEEHPCSTVRVESSLLVCQGKRKFSLTSMRKKMNVSKAMLNQKDDQ